MCSFDIGNFVNKFPGVIYTPIIGNARPLLYNFTIVLKMVLYAFQCEWKIYRKLFIETLWCTCNKPEFVWVKKTGCGGLMVRFVLSIPRACHFVMEITSIRQWFHCLHYLTHWWLTKPLMEKCYQQIVSLEQRITGDVIRYRLFR